MHAQEYTQNAKLGATCISHSSEMQRKYPHSGFFWSLMKNLVSLSFPVAVSRLLTKRSSQRTQ